MLGLRLGGGGGEGGVSWKKSMEEEDSRLHEWFLNECKKEGRKERERQDTPTVEKEARCWEVPGTI